ncbi:MAG TPA: sulfite reductase subunit alpha [Stellaceae bacterium]|nr:sulfite reductase subunit alpha [Stellaceae bacterium]
MTPIAPLIPENAPFTASQRAWLNGWLAAYHATAGVGLSSAAVEAAAAPAAPPAPPAVEEDHPWHDMAMPLDERMRLAEGRPLPQRLMAAMAQQDCGQCGYLCKTYAEAIATGAETALNRCVPGGKATARMLKEVLELAAIPALAAPAPAKAPAIVAASPVASPTGAPGQLVTARLERASPLNRAPSAKDTRQVVFDIAATGLSYDVGDALGVHAANCPETVDAIIECLGAKPGDDVTGPDGRMRSLYDTLVEACEIGKPSDEAIEVLASRAINIAESQKLQALAEGYPGAGPENADLLELLQTFPSARPPVQELIAALGTLQPRLYSISSSPKATPDAVHLTVATVRYRLRDRARKGVASTFLAERAARGAEVPVFVKKSHGFRLPRDNDAPMIMIGPGTGIAPFRAFLQERRIVGAKGRNWLFFGDQHRASDFLYEDEIASYHRSGFLGALDLAFSRDQEERIYVQQRMRERAKELWAWIEEGAYVYVCGSVAMGKDVAASLTAIIARQGGMSSGAAKAYLARLAKEERYVLDVY